MSERIAKGSGTEEVAIGWLEVVYVEGNAILS
jgi:hypothetical protein